MKTHTFTYKPNFELENGGTLGGFELEYVTRGNLNRAGDNVIWVCHPLTASANFSEWWHGLVEKLYDPQRYFIICANVLGGCYGSTGPLSPNLHTGEVYFHKFPHITIRDMVKAFGLLRSHLKINSINTLIGASMGGQQALEWAIMEPDSIERLVLVATNAQHSPWGIAFNESQRMAIALDPTWKLNYPKAGINGLKAARAMAMLSYRSYECYASSQRESDREKLDDYKASCYQRYQGDKLADRFNAYSYWHLSKAMDSHHVGRGRGGISEALRKIKARVTIIGIASDVLFPLEEQRLLAMHIRGAQYIEIDSTYGHDRFLTEVDQLSFVLNDKNRSIHRCVG